MAETKVEEYLPELRRREIFLALVEVQDTGTVSVPQSRQVISDKFGVTVRQIKMIENEGMDQQWPPL